MTSEVSFSEANEDTYESLISLIENSQQQLAPIIVACDDWALRQRVIDRYESEAREAKIVPYRVVLGREPSVRSALAKLKEENEYLQRGGEAVFTVTGAETLLRVKLNPQDEQSELDKFFGYLQWTREGLREFRYPIVLWVTYRILKEISRRAPDFWSWRKAVLRFETESEDIISLTALSPLQLEQIESHSDNLLPPLEELQAEIQQLEAQSPNSPNLATLYSQLGRVYADRVTTGKSADLGKEREAAIAAFQKAIDRYQKFDRRVDQATALTDLANFLHSQSRFSDEIGLHRQVVEIANEIDTQRGKSIALGNLGNVYHVLGDNQQAISLYRQALEIAREFGKRQEEGRSLHNLGNVYNSLGQYQQAIELYEQSLKIAHELDDRQGEAQSLGVLGTAYYALGQYQQAIELLQRVLEIDREIGDQRGEAISLHNLGNVYGVLSQYEQAIALYQQALEIYCKIGDLDGEAKALFNQALALAKLGQRWEELEKLQKAKQLYAAIGLNSDVEQCDLLIQEVNQVIEEESHI